MEITKKFKRLFCLLTSSKNFSSTPEMKTIEQERWLHNDNHCYSPGRVSRLPYEGMILRDIAWYCATDRVTYLTCVHIARVRLSFVARLMLGCKSYYKGEIFWLLSTVLLNKYVYWSKLANDKTHYQGKSQVYDQQRSIERCQVCCCKQHWRKRKWASGSSAQIHTDDWQSCVWGHVLQWTGWD